MIKGPRPVRDESLRSRGATQLPSAVAGIRGLCALNAPHGSAKPPIALARCSG